MARGTPALIGVLAVACCVLVLVNGALLLLLAPAGALSEGGGSWLWSGFLRVISPAVIARDRGPAPYLAVAALMAFGGIFLMSTLIPVISAGLQNQLARLRRGRSAVVESGHTILLGWSPHVHTVLAELMEANRNQRRACVTILAEKDRPEMETAIRERVGRTATTRVVCRSGDPTDPVDIAIVNPSRARSIIVIPPEGDDPDIAVVKSLLAVASSQAAHGQGGQSGQSAEGGRRGQRGQGGQGREGAPVIVASVQEAQNLSVARLAGGASCHVISAQGFISRLMVQMSLQCGLSAVYTGLLDFEGDEIYMQRQPELVGRTFGETLGAFRTSCVIGLMDASGRVRLNPRHDTVFRAHDQIVAISKDDDTVLLSETVPIVDETAISPPDVPEQPGRQVLMVGWSRHAPDIVRQLQTQLPPGSRVDVIADTDLTGAAELLTGEGEGEGEGGGDGGARADGVAEVSFRRADTTRRDVLESTGLGAYDHVMVICPNERDPRESDARTLTTLLKLRDLATRHSYDFSLATEIADDRNRVLVRAAKADDFIVSSELVSLCLAQLSENPHLSQIFDELFGPRGVQISLRPSVGYVRAGAETDFYSVTAAAARRGEIAIGHRLHDRAQLPPDYGVLINPDKAERVRYTEYDQIIILSPGIHGDV
ncbi:MULTISPECIES: potassium transporter TrkA [unclassified Streptomyces]|uniref:CASTOR/POLLUX-related putative ion channel n=1 Tax=Streptomyces TaxID=1883 RepID=UPI00136E06E8|nr:MULTISPECIES: potassium transporter TrkA [unclassified Streptomyces]NEA03638.1 potassium transporter TrkA [Streptomyces sp. SID10116]MYY84874.1 potassium transporter TrkA [Streptomyces sp. SID335]MYZ14508.1 potassium transporter TrkA [Streptomyces sp. SID337]NDZ92043.1 potassium transporter TrkA [Streptomyces sp. SID10115]NEB50359.1 potassium transporter TrkA [Streptomyces sp. SID339]